MVDTVWNKYWLIFCVVLSVIFVFLLVFFRCWLTCYKIQGVFEYSLLCNIYRLIYLIKITYRKKQRKTLDKNTTHHTKLFCLITLIVAIGLLSSPSNDVCMLLLLSIAFLYSYRNANNWKRSEKSSSSHIQSSLLFPLSFFNHFPMKQKETKISG